MTDTPTDRLILALDQPTADDALALTTQLGDGGYFFKIGYQLFPVGGYSLARTLKERGNRVFLDLKMLDIGKTVERGMKSLLPLNADMVTVHADAETIKGAVGGRGGADGPEVFAVTVLTNWTQGTVNDHGFSMAVSDLVLLRAEIALKNGADGIIASAREAQMVREKLGDALKIVTPGIRRTEDATGDQARITTPEDAIKAGADRLVVGRPIVNADDPVAAYTDFAARIATAAG